MSELGVSLIRIERSPRELRSVPSAGVTTSRGARTGAGNTKQLFSRIRQEYAYRMRKRLNARPSRDDEDDVQEVILDDEEQDAVIEQLSSQGTSAINMSKLASRSFACIAVVVRQRLHVCSRLVDLDQPQVYLVKRYFTGRGLHALTLLNVGLSALLAGFVVWRPHVARRIAMVSASAQAAIMLSSASAWDDLDGMALSSLPGIGSAAIWVAQGYEESLRAELVQLEKAKYHVVGA